MELFDVQPDYVRITADIAEIKEFREIQKRDNSTRLLSYIYHMCEWSSPYAKYPDRKKQLIKDFLDGEEPDEAVVAAVEKYQELSNTPQIELLQAARKGANALATYFREAEPSLSKNAGREAKDLMHNLEKVGALLSKFSEWEEQVKKEQASNAVRRGVKIGEFNRD
jgi:hypothetical protein